MMRLTARIIAPDDDLADHHDPERDLSKNGDQQRSHHRPGRRPCTPLSQSLVAPAQSDPTQDSPPSMTRKG
jgi:hypothetical protein